MQTLTNFIDNRLTRSRVRFASCAVITSAIFLLAFSFATTQNNRTRNGVGLGGDYLAFYNAGTILNRYSSDQLYDLNLQSRLYHQNLAGESENVTLPFANAPFIAIAMRPLAMLSYVHSYAAWIGAATMMFISAFALAWKSAKLPAKYFAIGLLTALSFEPFIIENLHGGQISTIGLFAICSAIYLATSSRPFRAGLMLSICTYKPTLLPFILPMLVITKQWRTIGGFIAGSIALATISLILVGPFACLDYVHMLTGYASKTATGGGGFQMSKFIDLNSFMKLLGLPSVVIWTILACSGAAVVQHVLRAKPTTGQAWAIAIACTLVLNIYVGVYDSILIIPAIILMLGKIVNKSDFSMPGEVRYIMLAIWITPWITEFVARSAGVQIFTIALLAQAIFCLRMIAPRVQRPEVLTSLHVSAHNAAA